MTRNEGFIILKDLIKNENLIKHHLACEVSMKGVYKYLNPQENEEEKEKWGIVGLLHDADYELTKDNPKQHTLVLEEKLKDKLSKDVLYAIKSHNWKNNGVEPKSQMDWAIYSCDELTGLIIAAALISPEKKLSTLTIQFVMNRFNESSFARGAGRDQIKSCEKKLGIPLVKFIDLVLTSMKEISTSLGF